VPTSQVVPLARPGLQQLAAAAAAFLAQPSLAASTRRSYQQTLDRLARDLGAAQLLEDLTVEAVTVAVITAWGRCHRRLVCRLLPPVPLAHQRPRR
jgi:hypothetical protein